MQFFGESGEFVPQSVLRIIIRLELPDGSVGRDIAMVDGSLVIAFPLLLEFLVGEGREQLLDAETISSHMLRKMSCFLIRNFSVKLIYQYFQLIHFFIQKSIPWFVFS